MRRLREARFAVRAGPSCDRGNHQNFIAILEGVLLVSEEADVFLVDVEVDETAHLSLLIAEVGLQGGKAGLDVSDQLGQIARVGLDLPRPVGVLLKCVGQ